jgi:SOS-response transcriptional repressor LexA
MNQERASKKQQELLSFVDGFIKGNGYGPSYREIMRALGYKSVSTVAIHVEGLIAKGYLARRDKSARSLEIVSLRSGENAPAPQVKDSSLEAQLRAKIKEATLLPEQLRQLAEALELLDMNDLARDIRPRVEHETTT